ncbi:cation/H(+) antiporter 19-like [Vigna radiata var. radiata]|uniref:Cation/H(+) antiporter 19-like n=1 Tax=Vigna radiata var. radiata TaxID=3916 RepID=A0A1S3VTQ4_VIGRR|nr:cation/H(+) antiporter 19-like [Vigna radiata var. radiata]
MPTANPTCPPPMKATSNGAFQHENPLDYALPLLILQICLVVVFTRFIAFILKPLRQPRVIAEVIGGILLGPSAIGRNEKFLNTIFPKNSLTVLETVANLGLLFFLFLVGLELDMRSIRRTGHKALAIAVAGITLPFVLGIGTSYALRATVSKKANSTSFLIFMGVALSITAFPVLARILAELKLLTTDAGRIAMAAAAVNDVAAWILLALAIALSGSNSSPLVSLWVILCAAAFVLLAIFAIKPLLTMMAKRSPEGEPVQEIYICITLTLVLACSFITDTIGIHALFGAFVVGIVMPKDGPFAGVLIEKIEDLVMSLLLPLYFVSSGLKTDVTTIRGTLSWCMLVLVIFTACFGKISGTFVVSLLCKVPFREALALGFLMNTKGLVELIVLNIGKDRKVLNDQTFAICVLMALFTTFITTPIVMAVYKPARRGSPYTHKTVQRKDPDTELRVLACFHSTYNIPTLINLIESSRGTRKRGKLCVYTMHLMELSERPSAITMVHTARNNGMPFWNKKHDNKDQMVVAFQGYGHLSSVNVRPMTAISPFSSMHEDICTSAHQKRVALILLPFHKHQHFDGTMESLGNSLHVMNGHVLSRAPCSVGILVDRGLGGTRQVQASDVSYDVVVGFFGGRDDREALAYGMRLAEHPGISLTVVKFVAAPGQTFAFGAKLIGITANKDRKIINVAEGTGNSDEDKQEDEQFWSEFMSVRSNNTESITYEERLVDSKEDLKAVLREKNRSNLILVGRMPQVAPLAEKSDCPELGPIGSYLASSEFSTFSSVLVLQQYNPETDVYPMVMEVSDYMDVPDTPTGLSLSG